MAVADIDVGHTGTPGGSHHCAGTCRYVQAGMALAASTSRTAVSTRGRMLDFRAVDSFRLRFSNQPQADLVLGAGVHGIGYVAGGKIGPIDPGAGTGETLVQLC